MATVNNPNRVVHSSHSWAIFGSFSNSFSGHFCVFGRETNKREQKMEWKMTWKMVTVNTLGRKFLKNGAKMHFSLQAHCQKDEKWSFFRSLFAEAWVGFHFAVIFLSFSLSFSSKMESKWNAKWLKNEWKMSQKCQLWTTLNVINMWLHYPVWVSRW